VDQLLEGRTSLGQFALLRCSLEIEALCGRCQLAEKRTHAQRPHHTKPKSHGESGEKHQD
jgi:hypothetical protein